MSFKGIRGMLGLPPSQPGYVTVNQQLSPQQQAQMRVAQQNTNPTLLRRIRNLAPSRQKLAGFANNIRRVTGPLTRQQRQQRLARQDVRRIQQGFSTGANRAYNAAKRGITEFMKSGGAKSRTSSPKRGSRSKSPKRNVRSPKRKVLSRSKSPTRVSRSKSPKRKVLSRSKSPKRKVRSTKRKSQ